MGFKINLSVVLLPVLILTNGCGVLDHTPQVAEVYKGSINCPDCNERWDGASEIILNQNGRNLSGELRIIHPMAGSILVPVSAGVIGDDGLISLTGHAKLPLGSIEVSFTGHYHHTGIRGSAILILRSPLAGSRQQNTILRLRSMS
jgi:hypothetical protein